MSGNTAEFEGGGIFNFNGELSLTTSAVRGNSATDNHGGGIFNVSGGTVSLTDTTVRGNQAINGTGGGIFNDPSGNEVSLEGNSLVCGNEPDECVGFDPPPGVCVDVCPA